MVPFSLDALGANAGHPRTQSKAALQERTCDKKVQRVALNISMATGASRRVSMYSGSSKFASDMKRIAVGKLSGFISIMESKRRRPCHQATIEDANVSPALPMA